MSPADFLNNSVSFSNPPQRQGSPLAGMLSALAASLETTNEVVVFQLKPWDDLAAARAWMSLAGPQTLVLPRSQSDQASPARILAVTGLPGRALADAAVIPTRTIADFVRVADLKQVIFVEVAGPVDVSDVLFFRTVLQRKLGLLAAEPRVQRVLQQRGSSVILEARELQDALECMSEALQQYAQRFLGTDAELTRPPIDMMDRLLSASGRLRIRPIETERGMTHLDIGVQVEPDLQSPAGVAVLYDTITGQWHDQ
jgi:hypothetical protein